MEIEGFGQVPATHPHLGQRFIAGKELSLPQAPYLGLAKVPGPSLLIGAETGTQLESITSCVPFSSPRPLFKVTSQKCREEWHGSW